MRELIELARTSGDDVPVAAMVLSLDGEVLSRAVNERERKSDPTAHAEILALREASQSLGDWRLNGTTLVVTLEPCVMCAGAISAARVDRVVFGSWEERAGAGGSRFDLLRDSHLSNQAEVIPGVLDQECQELLKSYFTSRRNSG